MPSIGSLYRERVGRMIPSAYSLDQKQADIYRAALEKAAYADTGEQYGQGLKQISNYLAGAGPLADSGAATALRARLASDLYRGTRGRIGNSYAQYLAELMRQRNQYNYQRQLMEYQKKMNKTGVGGFLGGIAGAGLGFLGGGPMGAMAGYGAGSRLGGGGGYYANDAYYG